VLTGEYQEATLKAGDSQTRTGKLGGWHGFGGEVVQGSCVQLALVYIYVAAAAAAGGGGGGGGGGSSSSSSNSNGSFGLQCLQPRIVAQGGKNGSLIHNDLPEKVHHARGLPLILKGIQPIKEGRFHGLSGAV